MLYFFHGSDKDKTRAKARGVLDVMRKKRPDAEYFRLTAENWDGAKFEELILGQGLFEQKVIVFGDGLFEKVEAKERILDLLKKAADSENGFVFLEGKIDAASLKKIEKSGAKVEKIDLVSKGRNFMAVNGNSFSTGDFNIFALGDAFGRRDKRNLWVLYREAIMRDIPPEEINGIIFWQLKSMVLAKEGSSAAAAGLAPFVFDKSKRYAANFSKLELQNISRRLVSTYHEARRGLNDFETALERLILSI